MHFLEVPQVALQCSQGLESLDWRISIILQSSMILSLHRRFRSRPVDMGTAWEDSWSPLMPFSELRHVASPSQNQLLSGLLSPALSSQMSCSTSASFLSLESQQSVSTSLTNFLYQTTAHHMNHISCPPSSSAMKQQIEIMRARTKFWEGVWNPRLGVRRPSWWGLANVTLHLWASAFPVK